MARTRLGFVLLAATLALACGGDEETVEIDGGAFTVESEGEGVRISGEQEGVGTITGRFGENAEIPDGFPEDVPVYPDAKVLGGMVAGGAAIVTLQTGDDPEKVASFYRKNLTKQGWSLTGEMNFGGQRMLPMEKGGREGAVQISREASDTNIVLTISQGD